MTLAYVFWHRPRDDVDRGGYEDAMRAFHATLDLPSATFRLDALPFDDRDGYEDWYLVEDWARLGALNDAAVDSTHRPAHDVPAHAVAEGWGGVYRLLHGEPELAHAHAMGLEAARPVAGGVPRRAGRGRGVDAPDGARPGAGVLPGHR